VSPSDTLGLVGVIDMLTKVLVITVNTSAGLVTDPTVAVIFVVPEAIAVATPLELIVALLVLLDTQVELEVRLDVDPSV